MYIKLEPSEPSRFSYSILSFSSDANIRLQDGRLATIPSPLMRDQVVRYSAPTRDSGLTVSVYCPYYQFTVSVRLLGLVRNEHEADKKVSELFISNDPTINVIRIPKELMQDLAESEIEVRISNTEIKNEVSTVDYPDFQLSKRTEIQVSTKIVEISDRVTFQDSYARKGAFYYYSLKKYQSQSAHINLNVQRGEADLYVRKGADNLPDLNTFDFRSNTVLSDEIFIPATVPKVEETDELEVYIIGVYIVETAKFAVQVSFVQGVDFRVVTPGTLLDLEVKPGQPLILAYNDAKWDKIIVGAACELPVCSLTYKVLDEKANRGMVKELASRIDKQVSLGKAKYISRTRLSPPLGFENVQYYFKLSATSTTRFSFFLEKDSEKLITLHAGNLLSDALDSNDCQTYKIEYDSEVIDEEVKVVVSSGAVQFTMAHKNPLLYGHHENLVAKVLHAKFAEVEGSFRLSEFASKSQKHSGPHAFDACFVHICAFDEAAQFRVGSSDPSVRYHRLAPNGRFTVDLSKASDSDMHYLKVRVAEVQSLKLVFTLAGRSISNDAIDDEALIMDSLNMYYMASEEFGFKDDKSAKNVQSAHILSRSNLEGKLELGLSVMDGFLVVQTKPNARQNLKLHVQLLVNNYLLISNQGETYLQLSKGPATVLQILNTRKGSRVHLDVVSCGGDARLQVFDSIHALAEHNSSKPVFTQSFGRDLVNASDIFMEQNRAIRATFEGEVDAGYFLIVETTNKDDKPSLVSVKTRVSTSSEQRSVEDYFVDYRNTARDQLRFFEVTSDDKYIHLEVFPIKPAFGFAEAYKDFELAEIEYVVLIDKNLSADQLLEGECPLRVGQLESEGKQIRTERIELKAEHGRFAWPTKNFLIKNIPYPKHAPLPLAGTLQIRVKFSGAFHDSAEDDSTFNIKVHFKVGQEFFTAHAREVGFVGVVMFILIVLVCLFVFSRSNKLSRAGQNSYQQAARGGEHALPAHRRIELQEAPQTDSPDDSEAADAPHEQTI